MYTTNRLFVYEVSAEKLTDGFITYWCGKTDNISAEAGARTCTKKEIKNKLSLKVTCDTVNLKLTWTSDTIVHVYKGLQL